MRNTPNDRGIRPRLCFISYKHLSRFAMTVLDEYALPDYDILAVYPQQRPVPAKIRFFIEHLKTEFNRPGYWTARAGGA